MRTQTIHLMVGNIGCGKSTTVRNLLKKLNNKAFVINDDALAMALNPTMKYNNEMWRDGRKETYWDVMEAMAHTILSKTDYDVIIDSPLMSRAKRKPFIEIAFNKECQVKAYLHRTPGGLERRIADSRGEKAEVWKEVFNFLEKEYEEPSKIAERLTDIIVCDFK